MIKKIVTFVLTLTISSSFAQVNVVSSNEFTTHKTDEYKVLYSPSDWDLITETGNPAVKFKLSAPIASAKTDGVRESINLAFEAFTETYTIEDYTKRSLDMAKKSYPSAKIISQNKIIRNQNEAEEVVWTADLGNDILLKFKQLFYIKNNKAYILTFITTAKEYNDTIKKADIVLRNFYFL